MSDSEKNDINVSLVSHLIALLFPQWADLPVAPVEFGGWDNRTFHLGDKMLVRLPSAARYADKVKKEQYWLPRVGPLLPLKIPTPVAMGQPSDEYPWHWSIYQWIEGESASHGYISDLNDFARSLAQFLVALHTIDTSGGPIAGPHNFYRGGALHVYDAEVQQALQILNDKIDTDLVTKIWDEALASPWTRPPMWVHGDIAPGNLLVKNGQLCAVIDFGGIGIGDPACDLAIAWTFFTQESREIFRKAVGLDNDTWARGRGWALWKALIVLAELPGTNPLEKEKSKRVVDQILAE